MINNYEVPEILYKYRTWKNKYHRSTLINNEIYLASADQFNDPFDAQLPFQYDKQELTDENILKKLIEIGKIGFPHLSDYEILKMANYRIKEVDLRSDRYWQSYYEQDKANSIKRFGIFSLTPCPVNLLMWSHYSDFHQGFCIGFDRDELQFSIKGLYDKVSYSDEFPVLPLFGDQIDKFISLYKTKSTKWGYEEEYRILKSNSPRQIIIINDSTIKEVIFGCKINPRIRKIIINKLRKKTTKIRLFDCKMDNSSYKLNLEEFN